MNRITINNRSDAAAARAFELVRKDIVHSVSHDFDNLAARWECESEVEDFNDYIQAMKGLLTKKCTFIYGKKRPFSMAFVVDSRLYELRATASRVTLKQLLHHATVLVPKAVIKLVKPKAPKHR